MKRIIIFFGAFFLLSACGANDKKTNEPLGTKLTSCPKAWIWFDLGDTLLDMKTHKGEKITYLPGALEYLHSLHSQGFPVGVITNVPEEWGRSHAAKLAELQRYTEERWVDQRAMDWSLFTAGIFLSPDNAHRKPDPYLFVLAREKSVAAGCPFVFQGETKAEVEAARELDFTSFEVGQDGKEFFLPIATLSGLTAAP